MYCPIILKLNKEQYKPYKLTAIDFEKFTGEKIEP
jgi:hypothetical protein